MGPVHFPEEQLITYLRVFLPEQRVSVMLDEIAEAAIRAEVDEQLALFAIAHRLMDIDERRTRDLEAAVLVAEVGLPAGEVAQILDLQVADVEAAVRRAWAEVEATTAPEEVQATAPDEVQAGAVATEVADPADAEIEAGAGAEQLDPAEDPSHRRLLAVRMPQPPRSWWISGLGLAGLVTLAIVVFSEAGRARLHAVGLDPVVAFFVVAGLIGGGSALIWAGSGTGEETTPPPPIGTPVPGHPLARPAAADHRRTGAAAPAADQAHPAAGDGRAASAADANGGPAAPSER